MDVWNYILGYRNTLKSVFETWVVHIPFKSKKSHFIGFHEEYLSYFLTKYVRSAVTRVAGHRTMQLIINHVMMIHGVCIAD